MSSGTTTSNTLPPYRPPPPTTEPATSAARLPDPRVAVGTEGGNVKTTSIPSDSRPATPQPSHTATGRMRSSIACVRCRRSKVKCVNSGVGTTCRSCESSGRDCSYPSPVTSTTVRRRDSVGGRLDGATEGERRQRPRKSAQAFAPTATTSTIASQESPRPQRSEPLDPTLLTPQLWQELFEIFQIHFSADLPFLHPPTFLKPLRLAARQPPASTTSPEHPRAAMPPVSTEFLLAFLALTARFHPKLIAHHSPASAARPSNPLIASEYYAAAANERCARYWDESIAHDIERTQAHLMLGLHEWGMCRGAKAWILVGIAIRSAQAMGLQYELDLDDEPLSRSLALDVEAAKLGVDYSRKISISKAIERTVEVDFTQQEVRRRTFWSCFIMDRYLSSGKYRPQMLHARELRIQLPASECSFLFAEKVRTLMLGEVDTSSAAGRVEFEHHRQAPSVMPRNDHLDRNGDVSMNGYDGDHGEQKPRLEVGADEGLVSRYIKILEIYGKVVRWSCAGGRRTEEYPPWDRRSDWCALHQLTLDFKISLPRQHTLTPQNTQAHISLKTSTPYTLVHTVYLLCQIMLHREYVPFIPLRCSKPSGPLDAPMFPPERYDVPDGFWEGSAKACFQASRAIMDLVRSCQEWSALVETPIIGFAIYTVAFNGVYCVNFPWMDMDGSMSTPPAAGVDLNGTKNEGDGVNAGSKGFEAARRSLEMIGLMRPRLHMADGWFKTITRMHKYFRRLKTDYRRNVNANEAGSNESDGSALSTRKMSLREGGEGGGLDEFKLLERTLKEFGNLEDADVDIAAEEVKEGLEGIYEGSSTGTTVKSEEVAELRAGHVVSVGAEQVEQGRQESAPWNAINSHAHGAAAPPTQTMTPSSTGAPNQTQFRSYDSYAGPSQHQQQHLPPQQHTQGPQQQQLQHLQPQQHYPTALPSFRPAYAHSHDTHNASGAPPSLTSASPHSTTTPSQPSPGSYEHSRTASYSWTPQQQHQHTPTYVMQPPPPQLQHNGYHPSSVPQHLSPMIHLQSGASPYPTILGLPQNSPNPLVHPSPSPQVWDMTQKQTWLNGLYTRMSGDDIAAFVDGGEMSEWATTAMTGRNGGAGPGPGWLSEIWGGGSG